MHDIEKGCYFWFAMIVLASAAAGAAIARYGPGLLHQFGGWLIWLAGQLGA